MLKSELRYKGVQTLLEQVGKEGCYVLCLLSIAEEVIGKPIDLIGAVHNLLASNVIKDDMYVLGAEKALHILTGKRVVRRITKVLGDVKDNEYTIEKWYNAKTGYTHFKRRPYDTLSHSVTVEQGQLQYYYIFEVSNES